MIGSSSNLLVTRTGIKSWTSSNSGRIWSITLELCALQVHFQWTYYGISKITCQDHLSSLDQIYMDHQWDGGGGKAAFMFWSRFRQDCGCHGNRKLPLTYNVENDVSTLTPSVLIWSSSNLQVTRTGITWTISNFGQIGPLPSNWVPLSV